MGCESPEVPRSGFDFGFPGEYCEIRCFSVKIVYGQKSDLQECKPLWQRFVSWSNGFGVEDWKTGRRYSKWRHLIRRGEGYVSEFYDLIIEKRHQLIRGV